jgi:hypothetical protein
MPWTIACSICAMLAPAFVALRTCDRALAEGDAARKERREAWWRAFWDRTPDVRLPDNGFQRILN